MDFLIFFRNCYSRTRLSQINFMDYLNTFRDTVGNAIRPRPTPTMAVFKRHNRHNPNCRFPSGRCVCYNAAGTGYQRLDETLVEMPIPENKDLSEREETMAFYNDDGSYQTILVERNLCASDLCQLLALKNGFPKSENWSLVEYWIDLGLERVLEDHEYVLSTSRDVRGFSKNIKFKYIFRKNYSKYEFFSRPQQFFPTSMFDHTFIENGDLSNMNPILLQHLSQDGQCPIVFSHVWRRDDASGQWSKVFLLLQDGLLYISEMAQIMVKYIRLYQSGKISAPDRSNFVEYADLSSFHVYATLNAKNQFFAPTEWGICLRLCGVDTEDETPELLCLACDSEQIRTCWLTAMRLAKYGKQLRENYRAFKNKQAETINAKDYNSYTVPNESVRSRVAMDFTGNVGRIVEDPKEAKAIAVAEGYSWKRRWRPTCRAPSSTAYIQGIESGVHITQPWFHSGMSRDQATALVSRHGTVDGVFLVRESRSHPGAFVLTYKCGSKILHAQIAPIKDPVRDAHVFSLDSGVTKFYDLLQLVEFYQLNAGCLPTRLTHYVVQNALHLNSANSNGATPVGSISPAPSPSPSQISSHHSSNG